VEAVTADSRHSFPRHVHDRFGIGVLRRGGHRSWSGRGMVEAEAGAVLTVNPGEVHDGMPLGDGGRTWSMLYLRPEAVEAAVRDARGGDPRTAEFAHPVLPDPAAAARVAALFRAAVSQDPGGDLRREELLAVVLADMARERGAPSAPDAGVPAGILRAKALADDDPAAPLTLDDLARAAGLGRFQTVRAFARATGLTPHAYLMQRRAALARDLIAGGAPLAEAAAGAGFADQSHMTRVFGRLFGFTPGAYAAAVG
jgi:AraC-like DNA-binding protein